MTKEEAIDIIRQYECCKEHSEACEMAISALEKQNIYDDGEHYVTISKALYDKLNIDYEALSQEMCEKCEVGNPCLYCKYEFSQKIEPCDDESRDFEIGDEVRIIGSDPIYDDCDVGWVIRNASEKVKTMYVMRNDGSAEEEAKVEWYRTGRHNAMLAEVIKALPSVTQNPETVTEFADRCRECGKMREGHWIIIDDCEKFIAKCSECGRIEDSRMISKYPYCHCGAKMVESRESER